jgi:hypothetical protein
MTYVIRDILLSRLVCSYRLIGFFLRSNDDELCKNIDEKFEQFQTDFWHKQHQWLSMEKVWNHFTTKTFCEIFPNTDHLKCFGCSSDGLLFLISHLSKWTSVETIPASDYISEDTLSQILNEAGKRNVMYRTTTCFVPYYRDDTDNYYDETIVRLRIGKKHDLIIY